MNWFILVKYFLKVEALIEITKVPMVGESNDNIYLNSIFTPPGSFFVFYFVSFCQLSPS
jgi:hypothetical protein